MSDLKKLDIDGYDFTNIGTLSFVKGFKVAPKLISSDTTLDSLSTFWVSTQDAVPTLPAAAASSGVIYIIGNAGSNTIQVQGAEAPIVLLVNSCKLLISTGSKWLVLG
jgi:hypothetical protein